MTEKIISQNAEEEKTKKTSLIRKIMIIFMIVLSIVGIVGFLIYRFWLLPSIEGHLSRSYDASRQSSLKMISLVIMDYDVNNNAYPPELSSGCVNDAHLMQYFQTVPDEKRPNYSHDGCNDVNAKIPFAYRVFRGADGEQNFILSATMENEEYGNSEYSIDEIKQNPELLKSLKKGSGKYYIVTSL